MANIFQTEEQRKKSFEAAGLTDKQIKGVELGKPTSQLTTDDLKEIGNIQLPENEPSYTISASSIKIPELQEIELSPVEQQLQDLLSERESISKNLLGEEKLRAEEEQRLGISEQRKKAQEYINQLQSLQAEEKAIPLQIQEEFKGRGVTAGGIVPIQTGRLRENAIKALTVNATLQGTLGNISLALDEVDRAVSQKYDPIREELKTNIERYNIIANSPLASVEQQNKARKLAEEDRKRNKILNEEKANYEAILSASVKAAVNGADTLTIRSIQKLLGDPKSENVVEANRLLSQFLPQKKEKTQDDGIKKLSALYSGSYTFQDRKKIPTFEEFIKQKEEEAQQSFSVETRNSLKAQYENEKQSIENSNLNTQRANKISMLSPLARDVFKEPKLYFTLTNTEKGKIATEIANTGLDAGNLVLGKKQKLAATQADDLVQARLAKSNIERISKLVESLGAQGPGIGQFRSANPFDDRVIELNNLITQTVPGLARGIFKEVGVLTDTDIDTYTRTIANPKLTKEQAETATRQLLETINNSILFQIEIYNALGYDLGTVETLFKDKYLLDTDPLISGFSGETDSGLKYTIE